MNKKEVEIWIRTNKKFDTAQYIRSSDRKDDKRRQLELIEKKICEMAPGMSIARGVQAATFEKLTLTVARERK